MKPVRFTLFGFPTHVGPSYLVLMLGVAFSFAHMGRPLWEAAVSMVVLFVSVLVHELGHALMYRTFRMTHCVSIHVHALGGHVLTCPECQHGMSFGKRFAVAVAGPAAGFALAAVSAIAAVASGTDVLFLFAVQFVILNTLISTINLAPALPLDGGRAMEATMRGMFGTRGLTDMLVTAISSACSLLLVLGALALGDPLAILNASLVFVINFVRIFLDE